MPADLIKQHRQLIALTEELIALVRRKPRASIEDIARLRARLGIVGVAHLKAEDERIMQPLFASGLAEQLPEVTGIIDEIRASRRYSADHASRWPMEAVEADLDGYADALDAMMVVIRTVTAREETQLYGQVLALLHGAEGRRVH